jgi:PleD family two-component response regulator
VLSTSEREVRFTVSVGVAEVTKGDTRDEFVARTSRALAEAIGSNGNCVQVGVDEAITGQHTQDDVLATADASGD